MAPGISVVIPAHNEQGYIAEALRCMWEQTRPPDEIVVACDACTDHTADVARAWGARAVQVDARSASRARNAGAAVATGDVLLIQDADTIASENYCAEVEEAVNAGYTFGAAKLVTETNHPISLMRVGIINVYSTICGLFVGAGLWVRRAAFEQVGGYDTSLSWGEDVEITERLSEVGRAKMIHEATLMYCERKFQDNGYWRETMDRNARMLDYYIERRIKKGYAATANRN
jgi:glycosyltransferase involved in cell wall biosynthesis